MPMLLVSTDKASEDQLSAALKAGYRGLECSPSFGNQAAVGKSIAASSISREDLFIISKVCHRVHWRCWRCARWHGHRRLPLLRA